MNDTAHSTRRPTELPFDDSEVVGGRFTGARHRRAGHGPRNPAAPVDAAVGAALGLAVTTGVITGADAAGGETRAGANVGLGVGFGVTGTFAATCTDDHKRPYHGCDASACAAAADADATGVG
ncbi:MAG TPA: hypothetical protein VIJ96_14960, partial [Acidothermaceae bacterium]